VEGPVAPLDDGAAAGGNGDEAGGAADTPGSGPGLEMGPRFGSPPLEPLDPLDPRESPAIFPPHATAESASGSADRNAKANATDMAMRE
jgi:hypothetical protein